MGAGFCAPAASIEEELKRPPPGDAPVGCQQAVSTELATILQQHPYLRPTGKESHPHPLLFWVDRCREHIAKGQSTEAGACLERVIAALSREQAQQADAFRRFDVDSSGKLDASEFRLMCAYIGWGEEEAKMMDVDSDGFVRLDEFQAFVGDMGGLQQLFERRRQRVAAKQWGISAPTVIEVGSRVRSYYHTEDGRKSGHWREAQVLALNVKGERGPADGVLLAFGFGADDKVRARQVVPPSWIFSDAKDSAVVLALREVGILDDQQAFWASIFPQSEMRAVECLVPCQREALANVRASATDLHQKALPEVRERFAKLGFGEGELHAVLGWIQDLAPMVIHVHLDNVGRFLETDEFYRNQFETKTSCGALDDDNQTRKDWERELFGRAYEGAKPFDRCKYGALSVMNDFRGVTSAYGYGDSYLVLKDVRLRATFAPEDSGGLEASRLAVLDQYAHVLQEYSDTEVKLLVEVAMSNTSLEPPPQHQPQLLRGKSCDPSFDWVTMGFPGLQQRKGKLVFEVELFEDARSPQVGLLSTDFVSGLDKGHSGVGDDKHGWACDGQHSMLWHDGRQLPWGGFWPSKDKKLVSRTVVGVAVDLDERQLWFGSDGKWDEAPAFTSDDIPNGLAFYPATSLQGRAAFNFGPKFTHPPLSGFVAWPKAPEGRLRLDCPLVGNDELMNGYKEIQIHGEVSLKRNVQRLVANRKYLEFAKQRRSWAVNVSGTGLSDGCYSRSGMRNGMPLYRTSGNKSIYWNDQAKRWHLVIGDDPEELCASAPANGSKELPREGWVVPAERRGVLAADVLQAALEGSGMPKERCQSLVRPLADGQGLVFRTGKPESFEAAWQKLSEPPMSADAAWALAVDMVKDRLLEECGVKGMVVETPHPYDARSHSWTKDVSFEGASALSVTFASSCRTYDSCATLEIYEGARVGGTAGIGARVQFETFGDEDDCEQMRGTVVEKMDTGVWKVRTDRSDLEASENFGGVLEGDEEEALDCFALCPDEHKSVEVDYSGRQKVGDEISGFEVDRTFPLSPFRIKGFKVAGSARERGVEAGWFLDVYELLTGPSSDDFLELEGEDLGDPPADFSEVFRNPDAIARRLEALLELTDVTLVFTNGLKTKLLPTANVNYASPVGDEVKSFEEDSLRIEAFVAAGPAQEAGVRVGWCLNAQQSASQSSVPAEQFSDPEALLKLSNVKLVFEPGEASSSPVFSGSGRDWPQCTVPGSGATLTFSTDGDGADYPDRRWGIFALVAPQGSTAPTKQQVDSLAEGWAAGVSRAAGCQGSVAVVPEDWDEARLRALCARHGWDFEWMTEDGERRRRIGEQHARSSAARANGATGDSMWWRLEAAATSIKSKLRSGFGSSKFKNEKVEPDVVQQDLDPELEKIDPTSVQLQTKPTMGF